jgi:hypothetical protein
MSEPRGQKTKKVGQKSRRSPAALKSGKVRQYLGGSRRISPKALKFLNAIVEVLGDMHFDQMDMTSAALHLDPGKKNNGFFHSSVQPTSMIEPDTDHIRRKTVLPSRVQTSALLHAVVELCNSSKKKRAATTE